MLLLVSIAEISRKSFIQCGYDAVKHKCPISRRKRLRSLCETRWVERHGAPEGFVELLDAVVLALEHMSRWKDASTAC